MNVQTAIILAAGTGSRLGELAAETPKAAVTVCGRPLVEYSINFARRLGVERIIVVGGFQFPVLRNAIRDIAPEAVLCENRGYRSGNIHTLDIALGKCTEGFILFHVDHIFRKDIIQKVRERLQDGIIAFADNDRILGEDDMKIDTDDSGRILKDISKQLTSYTHGYTGLTYCSGGHLRVFKKAVKDAKIKFGENAVSEHALKVIAGEYRQDVLIGDISGSIWHEIDFPEELARADAEITRHPYFYA